MPRIQILSCAALIAIATPASAQINLSPSDCAALKEAYGVTNDECRAIMAEAAAADMSALSDRDLENNVFFPNGGTSFDAASIDQIRTLGQILETPLLRGSCVRLIGHADRTGDAAVNKRLSLARAMAVADELRSWLSNPGRITDISGAGDRQTLAGLAPGAPENRRVTIYAKACN